MKLSKEKRDRILLVCVGTLAALAGLYFGLVRTRLDQLVRARQDIGKARETLEAAEAFLKGATGVEERLKEATDRLTAMEARMATASDPFSWSYQLINEAKSGHQVEIEEVTRPQSKPVELLADYPYSAVIFNIRGTAHYHDLGKFLADFENRYPHFQTRGLQLTIPRDGGGGRSGAPRAPETIAFRLEVVALVRPNS